MTALWRANTSASGPKDKLLPGRFHLPHADNPRMAICGIDLSRASFTGGGAVEKCGACLYVLHIREFAGRKAAR